jgi:alanyl-tRNA synthetase
MTSAEIRQSFLDFFKSNQHHIVSSSPVVPQDDPTLLFTNAGMNQFKDIFLGTRTIQYPRVANSQKCIRVSGKHNDLDQVGRDTYHHTFFEMLGNWSFGDYFKHEAIQWAWRLLTEHWKLPKNKLYTTYFKGDHEDSVPADSEAAEVWKNYTDIPPDHILAFGKKDNFWEMGETGPCGPCSEIHLDRGEMFCDSDKADHQCGVNEGCARFIELWNLVFIQYNRNDKGVLTLLPAKHVDTGAGFERLVSVLQNKSSNYDIDLFQPVLNDIAEITKIDYGEGEVGVAFRVIMDHIRALSFAIADGAIPGNEGRGYVLRRILRRAARFGRVLDMHEPFIYRLLVPLASSMGAAYPELLERQDHIARVIRAEEENFSKTLDRGIEIFEHKVQSILSAGNKIFPGEAAFLLHDTYGFPLDLTQLMAQEKQLNVDIAGFNREMSEQRKRSGRDHPNVYETIEMKTKSVSEFVGYKSDEIESTVLHYKDGRLVLSVTPFYPEAGGQIGDTGRIFNQDFEFAVESTRHVGENIVHLGALVEGKHPETGDSVKAQINQEKRRATERNHTVTHLVHRALRLVLGEHVHQAGSLVHPDYMRFDFTHFEKVTQENVRKIELVVNGEILKNHKVIWENLTFHQAKEKGAMALFGEKYGDQVRMVEVDDFSRELCGGTHVRNTGEIGEFIIMNESAVAAGIRRIECLTGLKAVEFLQSRVDVMNKVMTSLECRVEDIPKRVQNIVYESRQMEIELRKYRQQESKREIDRILTQVKIIDGIKVVAAQVTASDVEDLKQFADLLRDGLGSGVGVLASILNDKINFVCIVTKDLSDNKRLRAGEIVKEVASLAGGSGGGSPHMALAGAKEVAKLDAALSMVEEIIRRKMK